jgi:hypothetical protein
VRRRRPDQPCQHAPVRRCHAPLSELSRHRCRRLRRREFLHGERRPTASPRRSSPVELELSLLAVARPPLATVAPPRRGDAAAEPDFFSSPSTRSSGELACHPSCPAGSLTVVGARPPPLVPSLPLCRHRRPRRDARTRAGTAPSCAAVRRAVAGRAGRGRPSDRRPRPRGRGPCAAWPRAAHALCAWAEPTPRAWAKRYCASGPSVVSAQRHSN